MIKLYFQGRREKKKLHQRQTAPPPTTCVTPIERRRSCASNDKMKKHFWLLDTRRLKCAGASHAITLMSQALTCFPFSNFYFMSKDILL